MSGNTLSRLQGEEGVGRRGWSTEPGLVGAPVSCTAFCSSREGPGEPARLSHRQAFAPVEPIGGEHHPIPCASNALTPFKAQSEGHFCLPSPLSPDVQKSILRVSVSSLTL